MGKHRGKTNKTKNVTLPSSIERVQWADLQASPGGTVGLEISTRYVGNGAELRITLRDHQGKTHGTFKNQLHNNHLAVEVTVPPKAKDALLAEVSLPKHGLKQTSPALMLTSPVRIENAEWSKDKATRGEVLTLSADVRGVSDDTKARILILEHDLHGLHDPITELTGLEVQNGRVEANWEYEYHDDIDRILVDAEKRVDLNPPQYFFRVEVNGREAESGILNTELVVNDLPVFSNQAKCDSKEWNRRFGIYRNIHMKALEIEYNSIKKETENLSEDVSVVNKTVDLATLAKGLYEEFGKEVAIQAMTRSVKKTGRVIGFVDDSVSEIIANKILEMTIVAADPTPATVAAFAASNLTKIVSGVYGIIGLRSKERELKVVSAVKEFLFSYYKNCGRKSEISKEKGVVIEKEVEVIDFLAYAILKSVREDKVIPLRYVKDINENAPDVSNSTKSMKGDITEQEHNNIVNMVSSIIENVDKRYKGKIDIYKSYELK